MEIKPPGLDGPEIMSLLAALDSFTAMVGPAGPPGYAAVRVDFAAPAPQQDDWALIYQGVVVDAAMRVDSALYPRGMDRDHQQMRAVLYGWHDHRFVAPLFRAYAIFGAILSRWGLDRHERRPGDRWDDWVVEDPDEITYVIRAGDDDGPDVVVMAAFPLDVTDAEYAGLRWAADAIRSAAGHAVAEAVRAGVISPTWESGGAGPQAVASQIAAGGEPARGTADEAGAAIESRSTRSARRGGRRLELLRERDEWARSLKSKGFTYVQIAEQQSGEEYQRRFNKLHPILANSYVSRIARLDAVNLGESL